MSLLAEVVVTQDESGVRAAVIGEVDASNAEEVRAQLEEAITPPRLTIDLSGLSYLDSAGIRVIYAVSESATTRSTELRLVVGNGSPIRRVLDIAGVTETIGIDPGDAALHGEQKHGDQAR